MKFIVLFALALLLYVTPVYMLDSQIVPELLALRDTYGNAGATAEQLVAGR